MSIVIGPLPKLLPNGGYNQSLPNTPIVLQCSVCVRGLGLQDLTPIQESVLQGKKYFCDCGQLLNWYEAIKKAHDTSCRFLLSLLGGSRSEAKILPSEIGQFSLQSIGLENSQNVVIKYDFSHVRENYTCLSPNEIDLFFHCGSLTEFHPEFPFWPSFFKYSFKGLDNEYIRLHISHMPLDETSPFHRKKIAQAIAATLSRNDSSAILYAHLAVESLLRNFIKSYSCHIEGRLSSKQKKEIENLNFPKLIDQVKSILNAVKVFIPKELWCDLFFLNEKRNKLVHRRFPDVNAYTIQDMGKIMGCAVFTTICFEEMKWK